LSQLKESAEDDFAINEMASTDCKATAVCSSVVRTVPWQTGSGSAPAFITDLYTLANLKRKKATLNFLLNKSKAEIHELI
jgi:hypothetical protein